MTTVEFKKAAAEKGIKIVSFRKFENNKKRLYGYAVTFQKSNGDEKTVNYYSSKERIFEIILN